jgi:protein gp37
MKHSKIEWTDTTWNPVRGCSLVSAGCTNCYAMRMAHRFSKPGLPYEGLTRMTNHGPVWNGKIMLVEEVLTVPLKTKKPTKFFVNSMSDLFHPDVPFEFIDSVFAVMVLSPQHTFQILTKRPERMLSYFSDLLTERNDSRGTAVQKFQPEFIMDGLGFPLPNVWLGASVENQKTANERIPSLLQVPAAVRFLSMEPLLGPVELHHTWLPSSIDPPIFSKRQARVVNGWVGNGIDWIIAGGESGPNARPMHPDWVRSIRDQCASAGVPFFFKQWGEWAPALDVPSDISWQRITTTELGSGTFDHCAFIRVGKKAAGRLLDGRTHDEFPSTSLVPA